jgi:hypothetical protein
MGDLFEPMNELKQRLPDLKAVAAEEPERIENGGHAEEPEPRAKKKNVGKKSARTAPARKKAGKV